MPVLLLYVAQTAILPFVHLWTDHTEEHCATCEARDDAGPEFHCGCGGENPCSDPSHDHHHKPHHDPATCPVCKQVLKHSGDLPSVASGPLPADVREIRRVMVATPHSFTLGGAFSARGPPA